ncbi:hypothetical protein EUTSA_v10003029mg, partial [Eutrema salsugineum]
MERDELAGLISKKRRTGDILNREGAFSGGKICGRCHLQIVLKGLVSDDIVAVGDEFRVAICDQTDELKEPFSQASIDRKGVEFRALIRGLSESLDLGIKNVNIYCDDYEIYDN